MKPHSYPMLLVGLLMAACAGGHGGPTEPLSPPPPPPAPRVTGELWIQVTTNPEQSVQFEVSEPAIGVLLVQANQYIRLDLAPGSYRFQLTIPTDSPASRKCSAPQGTEQTVTVAAGKRTVLTFVVLCPGGLPQ